MASQQPNVEGIRPRAICLVLCVLLSDIMFAGLIFGWAPLLLLLQEEDQYGELCTNRSPTGRCAAQDSRLNLMYTIATFAVNIISLPTGCILDYLGPRHSISIAGVLEVAGLVLLGLADSKTYDTFIPGYLLLAIGGCITMMSSYPASFLIPSYQTTILASISCLFDSSSAIFLIIYSAHVSFSMTRQQLFLGYAIMSCIIYVLLIVLWKLNEDYLPRPDDNRTAVEILSTDLAAQSPLLENKSLKRRMSDAHVRYGSVSEGDFLDRHDTEQATEVCTIC
jgi:LAT3 family solute carrier family 43 protein 3